MSADLLREAGEALYGPRWQGEIARDLNVASRTVRRWAADAYPVPLAVWTEIRMLLAQRRDQLAVLRKKLPG